MGSKQESVIVFLSGETRDGNDGLTSAGGDARLTNDHYNITFN